MGAGEWVGTTEAGGVQTTTLYNNEGGQWQRYPSINGQQPVAQMRILRRPFARENEPLLDVMLDAPSGVVKQAVEPGAETAGVELALPAGTFREIAPAAGNVTVPLRLLARSGGTLTIKGAAAAY